MPAGTSIRAQATKIAVIGGAVCDGATRAAAFEVGRLIAEARAVLLCGGGAGVMEAAAEGARAAGGQTVGILPGTDAGASPPNRHIQIPLYTGMGQARNLVVVLSADAVVAIGGEWGTLSEIALAMKHGRPLVLLDSWRLGHPAAAGAAMPERAATAAEAVRRALELVGRAA
jgi:uncharacterized protein (TIGR00725 family)